MFILASMFIAIVALVAGSSFNDAGNRQHITYLTGKVDVRFEPGYYWSGIGSTVVTYPNNITISFMENEASTEIDDENVMEMGRDSIVFGLDGSTAYIRSVVLFELPYDKEDMMRIHQRHKSPEGLCRKLLGPHAKACLQSSGQLMSAEAHYTGGKAAMINDYKDQLANGMFLLIEKDTTIIDSLDNSQRRTTQYRKAVSNGKVLRVKSAVADWGITLGDATITDTRYSDQVMKRLERKQIAATEASIARQELLTAEQRKMTAKAQGEQKLTEIEYQQKQEQTKQVVAAETQVMLAKQDLAKQEIARQAAEKEAAKIKTLADAKAYEKKRIMEADGGLEFKGKIWLANQEAWAKAFGDYQGNLTPSYYVAGRDGTSGNAGIQFMEIMAAAASKDLMFNPKMTK